MAATGMISLQERKEERRLGEGEDEAMVGERAIEITCRCSATQRHRKGGLLIAFPAKASRVVRDARETRGGEALTARGRWFIVAPVTTGYL